MSRLIEHIILILNRRGKRKVGSASSQDGDVADASTVKMLKMPSTHHKLSSYHYQNKVWRDQRWIRVMPVVRTTGPNTSTARVENQEVARPMQDFLDWEGWGGSNAWNGHRPHRSQSFLHLPWNKSLHLQNMNHGAFHRTWGNGCCTKGDKMTLQHCHQVVIKKGARCVCMHHRAPWTQPHY